MPGQRGTGGSRWAVGRKPFELLRFHNSSACLSGRRKTVELIALSGSYIVQFWKAAHIEPARRAASRCRRRRPEHRTEMHPVPVGPIRYPLIWHDVEGVGSRGESCEASVARCPRDGGERSGSARWAGTGGELALMVAGFGCRVEPGLQTKGDPLSKIDRRSGSRILCYGWLVPRRLPCADGPVGP
jgi:hypothetical protein